MNRYQGFTLIELLVVISIISLLASVVLASLNSARVKARDARRASDIRELQKALELYFDSNNTYPSAGLWFGGQGNCWGTVTDNYIPGLAPAYISVLPLDPTPGYCTSGPARGRTYLYGSNGVDYKLMAHVPENCEDPAYRTIKDTYRDGGPNASIIDGNNCWAWSISTPGAISW
ncbi:MAG: type II secretion system protein [Candidatus Sungbacteria bacterium]|nr:type II secretion system protein [Candidatus Sungbacteria bacterium]